MTPREQEIARHEEAIEFHESQIRQIRMLDDMLKGQWPSVNEEQQ